MNFLGGIGDFFSGLFGKKRRDEEQVSRPAPVVQPSKVATPLATIHNRDQQSLQQAPTQMVDINTLSSQLAKAPLQQANQPKPPPIEPENRNFVKDVVDNTVRHISSGDAGREAMNNAFVKNVGLPVAAGAQNALFGLLGAGQWIGEKVNPAMKRADETQRRLSPEGKTWIDQLQTKAKEGSQLAAMSAQENVAKVPNAVPLFGGVPYAQIATEGFLDPFGRVNPFGSSPSTALRRVAGPTISGVASGTVQPAETDQERLQNAVMSGVVSSVLSTPPAVRESFRRPRSGELPLPQTLEKATEGIRSNNPERIAAKSAPASLPAEFSQVSSVGVGGERVPTNNPQELLKALNREVVMQQNGLNAPDTLPSIGITKPEMTTPQNHIAAIEQYVKDLNVPPGDADRALSQFLLQQRLGVSEGKVPLEQYDQLAQSVQDYQQNRLDQHLLQQGAIAPTERLTPSPAAETGPAEAPVVPSAELPTISAATGNRARNEANIAKTVSDTLSGLREQYRLDRPETINQVQSRIGVENPTPETSIKVYRAGGKDIAPGDHVTTDPANAQRYVDQREGASLQQTDVPLKELVQSGGLKTEFIYAPKAEAPPVAASAAAPETLTTPTPQAPEPLSTPLTMSGQAGVGEQVPVAPNTHDALAKSLGPQFDDLKGEYNFRDQLHLEDAKAEAGRLIANMSDDELIRAYQAADPETMVKDARDFSVARAALDRFAKMPDNPAAVQMVTNIMNGLERATSKGAQVMRIAQEEFDNMPLPMKVRYIIKKIDAANRDTKGYMPLSDDPARASRIEADLTRLLQGSQAIAEQVAGVEGRLQTIIDNPTVKTTEDIGAIRKQLTALKRELAAQNGETIKYYGKLVPGRTKSQRALSDFPRTMMLASFTGRINDIATTSANVVDLLSQNAIQGGLAKVINKFSPGKVTDASKGMSKIFAAVPEGLRKTKGEIAGFQYAPNLEAGLKNNVELRSGMQKVRGPVTRTVQAATELATNITEGVRDQKLYQLADQEAAQLGLKGDLRKQYAEVRSALPTRQMRQSAEALHKEVNNLNENPVTRTLNRVAASIQGDTAVGGLIKNQVMPFTSWAGGNIWNSVTDKNVVANAVKIVDSARKGDTEGIVQNIAKLGNNAVKTYAMGYVLSQMGVLTNEDAQGYNDAGVYIHLGDRYIPVAFLGFYAPSMILGNAAYQGLNSNDGQNPASKIALTAGENLFKSLNGVSALGQDNNLSRSIDAVRKEGGTLAGGVATFAGGAAGQFLPGFFGDTNAGLNNYTDLNPTREASDTKVKDPNSASGEATDVVATELNKFKNRIPFVSQSLPRKAGVAADDYVDRITRGNRDTSTSLANRADAKAAVNEQADFAARDVPHYAAKYAKGTNFEDAVKTRIERGEYPKAIEALKAKLAHDRSLKEIPESSLKKQQDEITRLQVAQDNKFGPNLIQQYKDTSLSEWRDMGDPKSDSYNPGIYELLYQYDTALANAGVSRNNTTADKNFYSAKEKGKGRGGGKDTKVTGNTVGTPFDLGKVNLSKISPRQTGVAPVPVISKLKPNELVKRRKIFVSR